MSHMQHQRNWEETGFNCGKWWNCGYVAASRSSATEGTQSFQTAPYWNLFEQVRFVHRRQLSSDKLILLYIWFFLFGFFRRRHGNIQERKKYISNKEKLLTAKIMEVKLTLTEVRNHNAASKGKKIGYLCTGKTKLKHSSLNDSIFVSQQQKLWSKHQVNQREIRGNSSDKCLVCF